MRWKKYVRGRIDESQTSKSERDSFSVYKVVSDLLKMTYSFSFCAIWGYVLVAFTVVTTWKVEKNHILSVSLVNNAVRVPSASLFSNAVAYCTM